MVGAGATDRVCVTGAGVVVSEGVMAGAEVAGFFCFNRSAREIDELFHADM